MLWALKGVKHSEENVETREQKSTILNAHFKDTFNVTLHALWNSNNESLIHLYSTQGYFTSALAAFILGKRNRCHFPKHSNTL